MKAVIFSMVLAFTLAAGVSFAGDAAKGKDVFNGAGKCKTCHKTDSDALKTPVGPGLAGVTKSYDDAFLTDWIKDPQGTWAKGGKGIDAIQKKVSKVGKPKTAMAPGKITDGEIADIIAFLHTL